MGESDDGMVDLDVTASDMEPLESYRLTFDYTGDNLQPFGDPENLGIDRRCTLIIGSSTAGSCEIDEGAKANRLFSVGLADGPSSITFELLPSGEGADPAVIYDSETAPLPPSGSTAIVNPPAGRALPDA